MPREAKQELQDQRKDLKGRRTQVTLFLCKDERDSLSTTTIL
jgi:hypothetical protein